MSEHNTLEQHLYSLLKQLEFDNGYSEGVHHLDMNEDHQTIMANALEMLATVKDYKTLSELKTERAQDTADIKKQLNGYLDKYQAKGEDTATLIGELIT